MIIPLFLTLSAAALAPQPQDTVRADSVTRRRTADSAQALATVRVRARATSATGYLVRSTRSATKTNTPLHELPQSITVLSAPLLADLAAQSIAKAVEYVPGITMAQGEGHRDAPTIRGQNTTADLFLDGVRDDAQYFRDTYNVEQIEALKGANALTFGRGGGGGVINRASKQAKFVPVRSGRIETGSFDQRRIALDVGQPITPALAGRVNVLYEDSESFRNNVAVEKFGINPTVALVRGRTVWQAGFERFEDRRTVDRGLPSLDGRPAPIDARTFVGDPTQSRSGITVNGANLQAEFENGRGFSLRSQTRAFAYDKFYQNVFADGAVNRATNEFDLGSYHDATDRRSVFNQTDATWGSTHGSIRQTLLVGTELSRQVSDNFRNTGFFDNISTTRAVSASSPTVLTPLTFRPNTNDPNNRSTANVAAAFVQEQLHIGSRVQLLGGVRIDRFALEVDDHRSGATLARTDRLVSPRAGIVITPIAPLSLYGSYSVSHLPSAGDQFLRLTPTTQSLRPEQFRNQEIGAKWIARNSVEITAALYELERSNSTAPDPLDARRAVQTGRQRTTGVEAGISGQLLPRWEVQGGVAVQRALIINRTSSAVAGATVPLVPHTTASLWNKVRLHQALSVGVGVVHQAKRFTAIDNSVTLPAFTRLDGALFVRLPRGLAVQANIENLLNSSYFATAHNNNNISPGAPRLLRLGLNVSP